MDVLSRCIRQVCLTFAVALTFLISAGTASAFKVDTHVFIAQQVLNDLADDRSITIDIGGKRYKYVIDPDIAAAIVANPAHFRMGSVGPDALPDIVGGQVVIHPGDEAQTGWGTGEWLRHVARSAGEGDEIAFANGYLVHAASDVFAHSYVNHYSGNVWNLADETYVERRHFILESFLASKNPPILDHQGNGVGSATSALQLSSGALAVPSEFVANALIFNGTAADKFSAGAPHLSFLHRHERNLADAEEDARELAIEIERLALFYWTGILANRKDIAKLRKLLNDIRSAAIPVDLFKDVANEVTAIRIKFVEIPADTIIDLLGKTADAYEKYAAERSKLEEAAQDVAQLVDRIRAEVSACKASKTLNDAHCSWQEKLLGPLGDLVTKFDPVCIAREQKLYQDALDLCERLESVVSLESQVIAARKIHGDIEKRVLGLHDDLERLVREIETIMIAQIQLENELLQAGLDLVKISQGDINVVVQFLEGWRQGVRRSGNQLAIANAQAIVNALVPDGDPMEPLVRWLECYTWPIAGVPHPLSDAACSVGDAKTTIIESLNRIGETLAKVDPASKLVFELITEIQETIKEIVTEAVVGALQEITGQPVRELLSILKEPGTTQSMTRVFSSGEQHNLRAIPDAAYRIGAEMHLTAQGHFDPDKFAVVYNAIVLSKLSLLGTQQLNQLAQDAGLNGTTLYGDTLFSDADPRGANILFGAVRSIDGSHQWMSRAMPFLRTWSHEHPPLGRFSYLREWNSANGFRAFADPQARKAIFRKIFKGPLVPGIDAPQTIGFPPLLLATYPYRVCDKHPFPDENDPAHPDVTVDKTCSAVSLATILKENPDDTREKAEMLKAVHTRLADDVVPMEALTSTNQWFCVSEEPSSQNVHFWTLKYYPDGRFNGRLAVASRGQPSNRAELSAVSGSFSIAGDFLFTTPTGGGYIGRATAEKQIPTLVRRFTKHAQRYWIERASSDGINLWNQDGTKLYCRTSEVDIRAAR